MSTPSRPRRSSGGRDPSWIDRFDRELEARAARSRGTVAQASYRTSVVTAGAVLVAWVPIGAWVTAAHGWIWLLPIVGFAVPVSLLLSLAGANALAAARSRRTS